MSGERWYGLPPPVGPDERRLLVTRDGQANDARWRQHLIDMASATFSIDAAFDSVATLLDQDRATSAAMTPRGFNPLGEYHVFVARTGYHGLFAQKESTYYDQYRTYRRPDFSRPDGNPGLRDLDRLVAAARQNGITLVLFIPPYHARYLEMLRHFDLWSSFEDWTRALVRRLGSPPSAPELRLIDFSGYGPYTTEPVPPDGDRSTEMRWYWGSGHFKSALGNRILERIFGRVDDFGRELDPESVEIAAERRNYLAAAGR